MGFKELKQGEIRRKEHIPENKRTPYKDECADYIESEVVEKDRWPMHAIEIADEFGCSRQYVTSVGEDYFERDPEDETEDTAKPSEQNQPLKFPQLDIEIPAGVENREDYLLGVIYGLVLTDSQRQ